MAYDAQVQTGWRPLKTGEIIPFDGPCRIRRTGRFETWIDIPDDFRGDAYDAPGDSSFAREFYVAVPVVQGGRSPKPPTTPKVSKVVWTPKKFPELTIRTTKRQIRDHLELAIMELNDLGAKWAKAQNTITALKKKVSK